MMLKSYLNGAWVSGSGEGSPLFNPTTGEEIARATTQDLDFSEALSYARENGGPALRSMSFAERAAMLQKMAESLHARREELLDLAAKSGGNTRGDAKFDVDGGISTLSAYARMGEKLGDGKFLLDGENIRLARNPRFVGRHVQLPLTGVAIHINAYNFPVWGMAEKAAVALLAGMPVVTKPATSTAALTVRAVECWVEDDILPAGALSLITGSPGDILNHTTGQDVVAFTGSASTAARIRATEQIVKNSVRVNVEADSLNGAVLGPDVNPGSSTWDLFLAEVARDMTQKAGQKCTAIRRILVPTEKLEEVKVALGEEISRTHIGNPETRGVRMGPVASQSQLEDVQAGITELLESCELVYGEQGRGELRDIDGEAGYFQAPVLLCAKDSHNAQAVHEREVFGPVSTLLAYDGTSADAIALIRKGEGGLVTSVYSDDRDFATEMMFGIAPFHGRLNFGSAKVAEYSMGPGTVLPTLVHGGPGRAGGGEELGGLRGLSLYLQRTAIQGDDPMLAQMCVDGAVAE
jgi:3,4-dehydroadipyl-CoA semialdehyde dehydrogenase